MGSPSKRARSERLRLLIVDDHPVVVTGCRAIFAGRAEVETFDVRDGEAGVAAYFDLRVDLGLIDINLPDISGFEVLRRILARDAATMEAGLNNTFTPPASARSQSPECNACTA